MKRSTSFGLTSEIAPIDNSIPAVGFSVPRPSEVELFIKSHWHLLYFGPSEVSVS